MSVSMQDIKDLRERTGAGIMDCKKALMETDGDIEKAIEYLREKGMAKAAKKAGRIAAEGRVNAKIAGETGVLVEVNCETDFVAKNEDFEELVEKVTDLIFTEKPADVDELLSLDTDDGVSLENYLKQKIAKIGENIKIRRFSIYEAEKGERIYSYIHLGGKVGVLTQFKTSADMDAGLEQLMKNICMHIAAMKPEFVSRDEVPEDVVNKEKEILKTQALNDGKPEHIVDKIVEGRLNKFYAEKCLLEQPYVRDDDFTVKEHLQRRGKELGTEIDVMRFIRYELGEGIEKKEDNFAEEVKNAVES